MEGERKEEKQGRGMEGTKGWTDLPVTSHGVVCLSLCFPLCQMGEMTPTFCG